MGLSLKTICFFIVFSTTLMPVFAQQTQVFDTILIRSRFSDDLTFRLNDEVLKKVSFSQSHPVNVELNGKHLLGDFGSSLFTMVSGIGLSNSKNDVRLKFSTRMKCEDSKHNLEINLFCIGDLEKYRQQYGNDDGTSSMDISRTAYVNWEAGAIGEIFRKDAKIGEFDLIKYPKYENISTNDPLESIQIPLENPVVEVSGNETNTVDKEMDYSIMGEIYGKNFRLAGVLKEKRFWLYHDDSLKVILQLASTGKIVKERKSYALVDKDMSPSETAYWLKIALYNAYLYEVVTKNRYDW